MSSVVKIRHRFFYFIRPIAIFTDIFNNRICGCFFVLACKNSRCPPDEKDGKAARMQNKRTVDNLRNIRILQLV